MNQNYARRLDFEGAINFRDLGGYRAAGGRHTRWRRLFRADSLADLTPADLTRLDALGLGGLIDFRTSAERALKPDRLPEGARLRKLELGFLPAGTLEMLERVRAGRIETNELERLIVGQYRKFGVEHVDEYRQALAFAADPGNYPLLVHCTSGKDRTGFAAAVLLLAVGVPREEVLEDYGLTNHYRRDVSHLFGPQTSQEIIALLLSAQTIYLESALEAIDRAHGSFDDYLRNALGVDDAMRERLFDILTES
jgi:protein-tyrosine phosphatase